MRLVQGLVHLGILSVEVLNCTASIISNEQRSGATHSSETMMARGKLETRNLEMFVVAPVPLFDRQNFCQSHHISVKIESR